MPETLPVTFRASPLPSGWKGTPQQFLDALVARLSIESQDDLSFFVIGSVAPSSNVGPWLKNGTTWYIWDNVSGSYIPEILEFQSLRYVVSQTAPSQAAYTFWIEVDGTGKAQRINTYSGGAWHDIYEDTFATMNAAIAKAANTYPASAKLTSSQTVPIDTTYHQILFNSPTINPDSAWNVSLSQYVAPVAGIYRVSAFIQVDNDGGDATQMEILINVLVDGSTLNNPYSGDGSVSPTGARWWPKVTGLIQCSAGSAVTLVMSASDGTNAANVTVSSASQLAVELVKAL